MKLCILRFRSAQRVCGLLLASSVAISSNICTATVVPSGDVTPVVPGTGGNVNTTLIVGNSANGQIAVSASNPATPIVVTGANDAIFGDDANVVGTGAFAGSGSNFVIGRDLLLGNLGSGNLSAGTLARITAGRNIVLGVGDGSGRLFVNDLGTVVEALDDIIVGQGGTALVQVLSGGRVFADDTTLGFNSTGDGTVTVSGNETLWQQSGAITVGNSGRGYLQIVSQARMETANAVIGTGASGVGNANVSGTGSVWEVGGAITAGVSGQGSLNLTDGGRLTNTGAARLGVNAGSEGTVFISGMNSTWGSGTSLTIGESGVGIMRVIGGGRVNALNTVIGLVAAAGARGEVALDGTGTLMDITGTLDVGNVAAAEALLSITSGAVVNTTGVVRVRSAAEIFMSGGRLNVGGAGLTNQGLVQGGGRINGAFNNSAGGELRLDSNNVLVLGGPMTNAGLVDVDGGELEVVGAAANSNDISIRDAVVRFRGGVQNAATGQMAITGGAVDVYGAVTNVAGGEIVVGGRAQAVFHDALTNSGNIFVRPGSELLTLEDLTFMQASQLNLTLSSASAAQETASLDVSGAATLAGVLNVQLGSGFAPQLGDEFQVLDAASGRTGNFASVMLPNLSAGLTWDLNYGASDVTLSVVAGSTPSSDFDGDGDVDAADLTRWRTNFGTTGSATSAQGDSDADGDVDGSDFLTWQQQLGTTPPASAAAAAIPEPASATLLAAGLALGCLNRRRR